MVQEAIKNACNGGSKIEVQAVEDAASTYRTTMSRVLEEAP